MQTGGRIFLKVTFMDKKMVTGVIKKGKVPAIHEENKKIWRRENMTEDDGEILQEKGKR